MILLEDTTGVLRGVLIAAVAIAALSWLLKRKSTKPGDVPQVPYMLPWLGNTLAFAWDPKTFLEQCRRRFGDIYGLRILGRHVIFVNGAHASKWFMTSSEDELSFLHGVNETLGYFLAKGLFTRMRNPEFTLALKRSNLVSYVPIFESTMTRRAKTWGTSGRLELFQETGFMTLRLNSDCFCPQEIVGSDEAYQRWADLFFAADPQTNTKGMIISLLKGENRCDAAFKKVTAMLRAIIEARLARPPEERPDDFLMRLVGMVPRCDDGSLDYPEIAMCIYGFMFAAQANTYAVMAWTLMHILDNPTVLEAVKKEQAEVAAKHSDLATMAALDDMPYLESCMLEAARLEISGSSFRRVMTDLKYDDFNFPEGSLVCLYTYSVHKEPSIYPSPHTYDPARLEEPRQEHTRLPHTLLTFGGGPHACLGRRFVTLEIKHVMSFLLRTYTLSLEAGSHAREVRHNPRQVLFVDRPLDPVWLRYEAL